MGVEPVHDMLEAYGFKTRRITDKDIPEPLDTHAEARTTTEKPFFMLCDTRLWEGIGCLQKAPHMAHYTAKGAVD
jgi:transketolase